MLPCKSLDISSIYFCCLSIELRLADSESPNEGHVEINSYGIWKKLWSLDWSTNEAAVVCHQLGYPGVVMTFENAEVPRREEDVLVHHFQCSGYEKDLDSCYHHSYKSLASSEKRLRNPGLVCARGLFTRDVVYYCLMNS